MSQEPKCFLAFSQMSSIGPISFGRLRLQYTTLKQAWQASYLDLRHVGITDKGAREFIEKRNKINIKNIYESLEKQNIKFVTIDEPEYPSLLKQLANPPFLLYYKGKLTDERDKKSIAVVGTRKISAYGRQVTQNLSDSLAKENFCIVSGLALGADTIAHEMALKNSGRTIGVLGSGMSRTSFYPKENWQLAEEIISNGGLVLSEYPPDTRPSKYTFPMRNRIVSGLCKSTLVTEAPIQSGSMITAKLALDQNRDVLAVPGDIYSKNREGTNELIKMGAVCVTNIEDVLNNIDRY